MHYLLVEIFQRYQVNFATLLCLKKSIRESAFREDIIMIVVAFSKYRCVIPNQIEFIHTNFFISVLARTDDIVLTLSNAVSNCSKDKIKEIKAEYENLKPIFEKLENLSSEKKTLPMNLEEDALTASEEKSMIQSGYLTRDGEKLYLPEIIRHALGFRYERGARPRVLSLLLKH